MQPRSVAKWGASGVAIAAYYYILYQFAFKRQVEDKQSNVKQTKADTTQLDDEKTKK